VDIVKTRLQRNKQISTRVHLSTVHTHTLPLHALAHTNISAITITAADCHCWSHRSPWSSPCSQPRALSTLHLCDKACSLSAVARCIFAACTVLGYTEPIRARLCTVSPTYCFYEGFAPVLTARIASTHGGFCRGQVAHAQRRRHICRNRHFCILKPKRVQCATHIFDNPCANNHCAHTLFFI
jgi:hypothetical protein